MVVQGRGWLSRVGGITRLRMLYRHGRLVTTELRWRTRSRTESYAYLRWHCQSTCGKAGTRRVHLALAIAAARWSAPTASATDEYPSFSSSAASSRFTRGTSLGPS